MHLSHLVTEPLYETLTTELRYVLACLFCLSVLFSLPYMFVSVLFWLCIRKCVTFRIGCTQDSRFQILAPPTTCCVTLDSGLTSLHFNFLICETDFKKYLFCRVALNCN